MVVNQEQLSKINDVQVEILKEVVSVCDRLGINYYMVHGSLLGTVMTGKFMPFDDDIDIAMPRSDYERFINEAPAIIKDKYFVQANKTDKDYPLTFAKVRDSETTYITEIISHFNINHGIYIDIFPIDYCEERNLKRKWIKLKSKILSLRVGCRFKNNGSLLSKLKKMCAIILCPSWHYAIAAQNKMAASVTKGNKIKLTGGKPKENGIPAKWFEETETLQFEGVNVKVPKMYNEYLTAIYGDYKNCFLADGKMDSENTVVINACIIDTEKPYTKYI